MSRPRVAFCWCASCGGCEESVLDLNEGILDLFQAVEIVFWPFALDFKRERLLAAADGDIAVSFVNGAIRTDVQRELAQLLRRKSRIVVAFGSCAHLGGIPGLANLVGRDAVLRSSYLEGPTVDNPGGTLPSASTELAAGVMLDLPGLWPQVHTLDQVVDVDYYLPGCAPPPALLKLALDRILAGDLPRHGSVLAPDTTLCDSCPRRESRIPGITLSRIHRPHEIVADPHRCFLDQGIICCGPATRGGCGETCIRGNMPCSGCFGPAPGVIDQGARMLTAVASLFAAQTADEAIRVARQVVDPAGTFNRYSVPASVLASRLTGNEKG